MISGIEMGPDSALIRMVFGLGAKSTLEQRRRETLSGPGLKIFGTRT